MPLILGTNSIKDTGYDVANSLRFNRASSDKLERTPSSAGNRRTFTFSCWFKLGKLASSVSDYYQIFGATVGGVNEGLFISDADQFYLYIENDGRLITNQKLRDTSAWYHVVMAVDTTNSTANNRLRLYLNGSEITSYATRNNPTQNYDSAVNNTSVQNIGERQNDDYFDGYMAEVVMIDGQQLDATSFGEFDSDTGIWKPIDVSGLTFGTNGFYLDFESSGSLGSDVSGNSNNFTVSNLTAVDQSLDTCTNNFATWNPLNVNDNMGSFVNGNLEYETSVSSFRTAFATFGASQGKWYFECKRITGTSFAIGIISLDYKNRTKNVSYIGGAGDATNNIGYMKDGNTAIGGSETSGYASYGNGDTVMVAMDIDNGKVYFGVNGTWGNSGDPTSGATGTGAISFTPSGETWTFGVSVFNSHWEANFGSPMYAISSSNTDGNGYGNFEYAVPSGYYALNTKNLAEYG
jgi:hypothetical protein